MALEVTATGRRASVAATSDLYRAGFDTVIPKSLTTAAMDPLRLHAHLPVTTRLSLSLVEASAGNGMSS